MLFLVEIVTYITNLLQYSKFFVNCQVYFRYHFDISCSRQEPIPVTTVNLLQILSNPLLIPCFILR